ncbi:NACHT, LRR and PYD domains-containing protein 7-like [Carassius auratus]|uniref:NACHT, LRR and PYD domains-containing protein 7-like n=1 Tax=Carassius auratus TaxID=7957 RepID=A0A6P6JAF0_CARAU|nr:NACHT, LRR and PYD domains-containing protein 7-like [Carassius auratus]
MSEERGNDSPSEMRLSLKQSSVSGGMPNFSEKKKSSTKSVVSGSLVSSSVSVTSDQSRREPLNFSDKKSPSAGSVVSGSLVSSSVSVTSDQSRREPLNFSDKKSPSAGSVRSGSLVSSSVSVTSDQSRREPLNFSDKKTPSAGSVRPGSIVSSSMSVKSDQSRDPPLDFSDKKTQSARRTLDSDFPRLTELENKIINFLKNELERFRKILQKDGTQEKDFVKDFNENKCSIKEAALELTLCFLREMKQHEAADTLEDSTEQANKNEAMVDLLKTAVDKALESDNGHLDLFLRFFLALSLQSNRQLLRGLLTQQDCNEQDYKEIWSALLLCCLTSSREELEEFELQKFKKSDECLIRLSSVIRTSKRALLNDCNLTEKSCPALATLLGSDNSLKELNINNNNLQDSGVKKICSGLKMLKCELEILRLSNCSFTEEGYKALALALRSNPSHLIELDLAGNDPRQSGVNQLTNVLKNGYCKLKILR